MTRQESSTTHAKIAAAIILFLATVVYNGNDRLNIYDKLLERLALVRK